MNGSGAASAGIEVRDTTSPGTLSGSLIWDGSNNYWKGGTKTNEQRLLTDSDLSTLNDRLDFIETESGSIRSDFNTYTSSNDSTNTSQNSRLSSLETKTGSLDSTNTTQNNRISSLETKTGSLEGSVDSIETFTSSINTTIKNKLNTETVISGSEQVDHNSTSNYDANEHIDHSTITIGSGKGLSGGGTITTSRSLTLDTGSNHFLGGVKEKLNSETVVSGSEQIDITATTNYNLVDGRLDSIETKTGSLDSTNTSQNSRLSSLETFTGSIDNTYATDTDVTNLRNTLNTYTSSNDTTNTTQNSRLGSLETKTGSLDGSISTLDGRVDSLETKTGSLDSTNTTQNNRLSSLETKTGSLDSTNTSQNNRLGSLETKTGSLDSSVSTLDGRVDSLETTSGSHKSRLDSIESVTGSYLTSHPSISAASSSDNTGRTYIQDITLDSNGHVTGLSTATETVVNTDEFVTGATWNNSNAVLTFTRNDGDTFNVTLLDTLSDVTVTGGTYNSGTQTLTLTKNDGNTVSVSGFAIDTDVNYYLTGATFNTSNGVLTLNVKDSSSVTVDLDGRFLTEHPSISAATSSNNGGRTYIQDILLDGNGHVTGVTTATETVTNTDTNFYTTGATFNTGNGIITFTNNQGDTYTVDIDGKFLNVTGDQTMDGSLTLTERFFAVQTASNTTPGYSFSGDSDTGLSRVGVDAVGLIAGGSRKFYVNSTTAYFQNLTGGVEIATGGLAVANDVAAASFTKTGGSSSEFLKADGSVDSNTYLTSHPSISAASSSNNGGRTYIQDILLDGNGHVTGLTTATESVTNTDEYTTGATFNKANGIITFTRNDGDTYTVDIDSRYLQLSGGNMTGNISFNDDGEGIEFYSTNSLKKVVGTGMVLEVDSSRSDNLVLQIKRGTTYDYMWHTGHFTSTNVSNWDTAYGWGDHSTAGYLTSYTESDTLATVTARGAATSESITIQNTLTLAQSNTSAVFSGNSSGNLTIDNNTGSIAFQANGSTVNSLTITSSLITLNENVQANGYIDMGTNSITDTKVGQWDTAYGWGDHSTAGYLTTYNDEYTTGATWNSGTGVLTFTRNDGDTFNVTLLETLSDVTVTGGTYNSGNQTLTLTKSDGNTVSVSGFAIDTDVNYYTTGATFNTGNGIITGTLNNGSTWTVDIDGRYLTSVTNISGYAGTLEEEDNRTISPSELTAGRLKFGFTSWSNNNTSPYADFLHMRSYGDSSGGSDNLVMFKKSGIGMRIWQQTYGSSTAYSSYADVWTTGDFTSTDTSNWDTAYGWGDHSTQGYLTTYNNEYTTGATFNTGNGIITFTRNDGDTYTVDIDGRFMTQGLTYTTSPNTINNGGNRYDPHADNPTNEHYAILTYGNGGNVTGQLATHFQTGKLYSRGHNNSWSGWRTYWSDSDFTSTNVSNWNTAYGWGDHSIEGYVTNDEYTTGATFNTSNGVITFTRNDGDTYSVDLDNRYAYLSHDHARILELSTIQYGTGQLQWTDVSGTGGAGTNGAAPENPFSDWFHHLIMNHANSGGYYVDIAACFHSDDIYFRRNVNGSLTTWRELWHTGHFTSTNVSNWDTAYGWGNHSGLYLPIGGGTLTGDLTIGGGDLTINKDGNYSTISFPAQTNDPGFIRHYESNNTATMQFSVSDDSGTTDRFEFGYSGQLDRFIIYSNGSFHARGSGSIEGHFTPGVNNTYDLGSSSSVWRNIYTGDLHMSNMGQAKGNDVDGTKGNWTIQEGAENLYIINNNNGKKFRVKLEEV